MEKYTFGNVAIDVNLEEGFISSFDYEGEQLVHGKVPFAAVKLRDKKGASTWVDVAEAKYIGIQNGYHIYEHELVGFQIDITKDGDAWKWRVNVTNKTENLLEQVEVMSIGFLDKLQDEEGGKGSIVFPFNEGALVTNLQRRLNSPFGYFDAEYPSLGKYNVFPNMLCSQFMAYIAKDKGVYFGMHDSAYTPKHIDFRKADGALKMQLRTFTNCNYGENYKMPFDVVMKFFRGNYYDAFDVYRRYFDANHPSSFQKIKDNASLPAWYAESPIVVAYPVRGHTDGDKEMLPNGLFPYVNGIPHLEEIAKATSSKVMSLLMHWEGTGPWAPPYSWPPYGGEEAFKAFTDACHERDILVGLYTSGLGWTNESRRVIYSRRDEFERDHLADVMCANSDGSLKSMTVCEIRDGYDMCPALETTKKIICTETNKILDHDIDYLQVLDQNHGGCSYFCYSQNHGHIPAPGAWQIVETKALLNRIDTKKAMLGCESGAAEPFLDQLQFSDNRFILNYYIGLPIPMYSYLYHEYVNNFMGNQICMALNPEPHSFTYRLAYSFCCGDMFALVLNDQGDILDAWGLTRTTDKERALSFLATLNDWRKAKSNFLHEGRMVKPMEYRFDSTTLTHEDGTVLSLPTVLTASYEFHGEIVQFFVNYTLEKQFIEMEKPCETLTNCTDSKGILSQIVPLEPMSVVMVRR